MSDPVQDCFDGLSDATEETIVIGTPPVTPRRSALLLPLTIKPDQWDAYHIEAAAEGVTIALVKNNVGVFAITAPDFRSALGFASAFNAVKFPDSDKPKKKK